MRRLILLAILLWCFCIEASIITSNVGGRNISFADVAEEGISAKSYIQNGLISQWDGIENVGYGIHDDSSTRWIDLKSEVPILGIRFDTYAAIPTGTTPPLTDSRYYGFRIDRDFTMHGCLINPPRYWTNWTLVGIGRGAGCENGIVLCARDGEINYSVAYRSAYSGTVFAKVNTGTVVSEKYVVDIVFHYETKRFSVYVNSLLVGSSTIPEDNWNLDGVSNLSACIGLFHNLSNIGDFRVFDFMLYERCLTEEEISYNHAIDKERFGL